MAPSSPSVAPRQATVRQRGGRKPRSGAAPAAFGRFRRRWTTAALLLASAVLVAAYVANAIAVNGLVASIASLEKERDAARGDSERLRSELLRLMSVERVSAIATGRLGLVQPSTPPIALSPAPAGVDSRKGGAREHGTQR